MTRILLTLAAASVFTLGCGKAALQQEAGPPAVVLEALAKAAEAPLGGPAKADVAADPEALSAAPSAQARMPGDYVVYRFSGAFRKTPLTLTQKVVGRDGARVTVDLTLKDGDASETLRVTFDEASPSRHEVVSVARIEGGAEKPATVEAYEKLMTRTTLIADQNEALVGTEDVTVDVGGAQVAAKRTTYKVRVGKQSATLSTLESAAFVWGDVGGEIVGARGKVLYKAEVVEAGRDGAAQAAAALTK
jgi:hypothetical protein